MAEVRVADLVMPVEAFLPAVIRQSIYINAYFQTGLVANSPALTGLASANQSATFDTPFLGRLADTQSNVSSDDPGVLSTPEKIGSERETAIKMMRNNSWSAMDLTAALTMHDDPMTAIEGMVAQYWSNQYDLTIQNIWTGLVANNVANDASDMVVDFTTAPVTTISAANAVDTMQTMGDRKDSLQICIMHSQVHANAQKQNLIVTVDSREGPAESNIAIDTFLGKRVVVSDNATRQGANYITIFGSPGVLQFGTGAPKVPTEIDRLPAAGNGEGQEILHSRNHFVFHPVGHRWLSTTMAGVSPTWAEIQDPGNWARITDRKRVEWAAMITTG